MWRKLTLSDRFESESCCFADIDGDGQMELVAGDSWWRLDGSGDRQRFRHIYPTWLPDWPHRDRIDPHAHLRRGGGPPAYRNSTYDWAVDLTGSGLPDVIWVGMHKDPIVWSENRPGPGNWPVHEITRGGIYESVVLTTLGGKPALVTVPEKPLVAWYEPQADPRRPWTEHRVGDCGGDWHGLGCGDLDDDGLVEIITRTGFYRQGVDPRRPWFWKPIEQITETGELIEGLGDVFAIEVADLTGAGVPALVSSSPHRFGLWWWEFVEETPTVRRYRRRVLNQTHSQLHAIRLAGVAPGAGPSIICGKRWHAHGPDGDVDAGAPPVLFAYHRGHTWDDPVFELIDDASGVGLRFDVWIDSSSAVHVGVSNKRGVHLFSRAPHQRGEG